MEMFYRSLYSYSIAFQPHGFYMRKLIHPALALVFLLTTPVLCWTNEAVVKVGEFSRNQMSGWKAEEFEGLTDYSIQEVDGQRVLRANSRAAASGLYRKIRVDLWQYPYLNWRWKIDNRLPVRNETTKEGDDYPVRLYIVVDGKLRVWKTKSLNYVWSRGLSKGSAWPNAFADNNVVMLSVRDGSDDTNRWYEEKRNVLQDVQRYLSPEIRYIDVVAIMTDTDNTHSFANSYYGDIYFSNQ